MVNSVQETQQEQEEVLEETVQETTQEEIEVTNEEVVTEEIGETEQAEEVLDEQEVHKTKIIQPHEFGKTDAQEALSVLEGVYTYPSEGNLDEVNNLVEEIIERFNLYGGSPKFSLNRALYPSLEDETVLDMARFTVKPVPSEGLWVSDARKEFTLLPSENFFNEFIREMSSWMDDYVYLQQIQTNLEVLNETVQEIVVQGEIPFRVEFTLGEGVKDATDKSVLVGVDASVAVNIANLILFDEIIPSRQAQYRERILEVFKEIFIPIEIVKVKSQFTDDLKLFTRKSFHRIVREFVSRKIEHTRVGVGYFETDKVFAVVEKTPMTEEEALEYMENSVEGTYYIMDSEKPTKREKENGKTKLLVTFKISPFNKDDGTVDETVTITDIK